MEHVNLFKLTYKLFSKINEYIMPLRNLYEIKLSWIFYYSLIQTMLIVFSDKAKSFKIQKPPMGCLVHLIIAIFNSD